MFDRASWEETWVETLRDHAEHVAHRPPNGYLTTQVPGLAPGRALDAGCGHGAESVWLAAHGWQVTAVDFAAAALANGRRTAESMGLADRIDWVEADLVTWMPQPGYYQLVTSLYVGIAGSVSETVDQLGKAVAPGGTLLLVGHHPLDPVTAVGAMMERQAQISIEEAKAVLDPQHWEIVIAEERPRPVLGDGSDALIRARKIV